VWIFKGEVTDTEEAESSQMAASATGA
jgi:hypothetical protein